MENVFFPLDGSAPPGTYTYFVDNFNQVGLSPDLWTLEVFVGDMLISRNTGVTDREGNNSFFNYTRIGTPTGTPPMVAPTITPTGTPMAAPTIITPTTSPTSAPISITPIPTTLSSIVSLEDYYISFVAPMATREPTPEEYNEMGVRINDWFEAQLTAFYTNVNRTDVQFLGTESSINCTLFGGSNNTIPPRRDEFNIYMNFEFFDFTFSENSNVPTTAEVVEIMIASISRDFILQVVRTYTGTPFESTNEVFISNIGNVCG